jgi:hypothetical protein
MRSNLKFVDEALLITICDPVVNIDHQKGLLCSTDSQEKTRIFFTLEESMLFDEISKLLAPDVIRLLQTIDTSI